MISRVISRQEFDQAMDAVWSEMSYQDNLPRRTPEREAKDVPGFITLGRHYEAETAHAWAKNPGHGQALHGLRKLAAIYVRSMIYCGVTRRVAGSI